jgi:hypothetical protein
MGPLRECVDVLKETDGRADAAYNSTHDGRGVDVAIETSVAVIHARCVVSIINHAPDGQVPSHQTLKARYLARGVTAPECRAERIELDDRGAVIVIQPLPNLPSG